MASSRTRNVVSRLPVFLLVFSLCLPLAARAETIDWSTPGTPSQTAPWFGGSVSLFPTSGASGNTVNVTANVNGSGSSGGIFGGISYDAAGSTAAADNIVNITGSTVSAAFNVYGGNSYVDGDGTATATGNSVNVTGSDVSNTITGGWAYVNQDGTATASGNSVDIADSTIRGSEISGGGGIIARLGTAVANGNTVRIINSTASGAIVYGGIGTANTGDVAADGNTVSVSGSTVNEIHGGNSKVGGGNGTAKADNNTVTIIDSSVTGNVYGGHITPAVYTDNTARNNTVTLQGTTAIGGHLAGGDVVGMAPSDIFTGNTLNVKSPQAGGITVGGNLKNFQFLNFYVPGTMVDGGVMLDVTGTADLTDGAGRSSTVNVGIEAGSTPLQVGHTLTLINAGALTGTPANTTTNGQGMQGLSLLYGFALSTTATELLATVTSTGVNPQTKALSEGRAGGMAFVTQGADLAAGQGMGSALAATSGQGGQGGSDGAGGSGSQGAGQGGTGGVAGFGAISGGSMRYNTGSHVNVDGFSLMTGLGWRAPLPQNSLLLGAFFEAGWGSYDSHNSFSSAASVKGDGDTSYYGGGILARYGLTDGQLAGLYTEASLRAGHVSTDFSSSDLRDVNGQNANYDSGAAYYGAHAGLGYIWRLNNAASLDFSTKYLWTHQNSDSVTVAGDPIRFKAGDSQRWRNGARFNYALSMESGAQFTPYIGAAWEYEFDGEAKATTYGRNIDSPSLKGGTGMGELGISFKPAAASAFSMDAGIQGYTGVREGVTGSVQLKWEF